MPLKGRVYQEDHGVSINVADYTSTQTGSEVCITGALEGTITVNVPVGATTTCDATHYFTFTVTQATASGGTFSAASSWQYGAIDSWDRVINSTTEANALYRFNFLPAPTYDYIKVVATESGTGQVIFGAYVTFEERHKPAST